MHTGPSVPVGTCGIMFFRDFMGQVGTDIEKLQYLNGGWICHDVEFDGMNAGRTRDKQLSLSGRDFLLHETFGVVINEL